MNNVGRGLVDNVAKIFHVGWGSDDDEVGLLALRRKC
jgi:hypothetical protein